MVFHDMWSTEVVCIMNIVLITIIIIFIIIINNIVYIYIYVPDWWFGTFFIFPYIIIYWEFHHPNWRTHIFQRGRYTTNQIYICIYICVYIYIYMCVCIRFGDTMRGWLNDIELTSGRHWHDAVAELWKGWWIIIWVPSGKHTRNDGKSPFLIGKSTICMCHFQ